MKGKKIILLFVVILLVGAVGLYIYINEAKINGNGSEVRRDLSEAPFADVSLPTDVSEATRAVIQIKIDNTREAYEIAPDAWETWIAIGNLKVMLKNYEGAIEAYRESIVLQNNNILGYRNMAEVYKNNIKDFEKAKEYYRLAVELNPGDPDIYIALALVEEYKLKDMLAAEEVYLNGLRTTNNNFEILNRILTFYQRSDELEKAKEIQDRINNLYPDSPAAQQVNL